MKSDSANLVSETGGGNRSSSATGLTRQAVIIGFVSFFADISTEIIYPLLPLFITGVLKAPAVALGLIEGIAQGASSVVSGFSGYLSDRLERRKPLVFIGYFLTAICKPLIAAAGSWPLVMMARFADRFGKGIRSAPRDALLSESVLAAQRGRGFGFERAMDNLGAVAGPLLAIGLVTGAGFSIRTMFWLSAIPATIAALLILLLKETKRTAAKSTSSAKLSLKGTKPEFKRLLIVTAVFGLANSANAFLILRASQLGLSAGWTILAYTLYNAVAALASIPAGSASDRFGRNRVLAIGYSIYALAYLGFGLAGTAWLVWPLFALYGLFPALTDGVGKALAIDTAGTSGRGAVIGVYSAVVGLTQIGASVIGGGLWDTVGPRATFFFGAGLAAVAVVLLSLILPMQAGPAFGKETQ